MNMIIAISDTADVPLVSWWRDPLISVQE